MEELRGQLLVASSDLLDPNFLRTVVLIVQHGPDGALGLVLNRRTSTTLKQVWQQVGEATCGRDDLLHLGGPVSGPLMAVHTIAALSEMEVVEGLYFTASAEGLRTLAAEAESEVRFFVGHAGWGAGQLESEIEQGSWLRELATVESVFSSPDDLWLRVTRQIVGSTLISTLNIKHVPPDPSLN